MQFLDRLLVVAEIFLATDENDGKALAEMEDFRDPLWVKITILASISCNFSIQLTIIPFPFDGVG